MQRKSYIVIAITCFTLAGLCIWLMGCAAHTYQPVCRHYAIFQAMAVHNLTGQPTRIVVTKNSLGICDHAYAQTFRDDKWRSLWQKPALIFEGDLAEGDGEIAEYWDDYELAIKAWLGWR